MKPQTISHWLLAYAPPMLWALLIFFLSAQSGLPSFTVSGYDFIFKKLAHITVYAVLFLLLHRAHRLTSPKATTHAEWLIPFLITLLYAVTDEYHQSLVPGRTATLRDIGYDSLGISIAFLWRYKYV